MSPSPHTAGILGLGSMGRPMAGHVIAAEHDTVALQHSLHKADGARAVDAPRHMARQADVVILLLRGALARGDAAVFQKWIADRPGE